MAKIGFIGIGKLGLDCAEVFATKHEVRGYDIYPRTSCFSANTSAQSNPNFPIPMNPIFAI